MRRNLFLHFLNRDTREIFRLYDIFGDEKHARTLRGPMNACAMLCEEFCVAPPGFVVEDKYAFELFEVQSAYLEKGLVRLPMRETNLTDFAEKKRLEYSPARNRYSGLYDDTRMNLLSSHGAAFVQRKVQIGPTIVNGFETGIDTRLQAWSGIRQNAPSEVIENMRTIPARLADDGKALTWSMIEPNLVESASPFRREMRDALQYTYFQEYCREFKAIVLTDIPHMPVEFYLPAERAVYSMRRFRVFLDGMSADKLLLEASADTIMRFRRDAGFIELMDVYCGFARMFPKDTDLQYHLSRAIKKTPFEWSRIPERFDPAISDPSDFEVVEIASAFGELAANLTMEHGLPRRGSDEPKKPQKTTTASKGRQLTIAIFVALEEELDVLIKHFDLERSAGSPAASGKIGDVGVDVLCPRAMGRVAAAVEVTRYLSKHPAPDLLFCVGLAGGFEESGIEQGAVICAETVVDLANRKVTDDENGAAKSKFRRRDFDCTRAVYEVAKSNQFDLGAWASHSVNEFDWQKGRTPSLWEGKIASADEVVASDNLRKKMVDSVDKLFGVEMEAGGVCAAATAFKVPVSVLRVVSDMADPSKADDKWRTTGMKTLAELLKRLPLDRVIAVAKQ
ncbi:MULTISPECIES: hypothetical protein [unclassified Rhizobium]|uniref:5'-methylthioadenosine/S-adenosylhomocysteine nucleosidase family protein n=1 Tax=unclassified Rhizobium TaxID=2613769 RepID=UPI001617FFE3|nr:MULTISPECIES: hypothetical protein [unclassified Rhizobium]MBB3387216.1 nucleoside phosphorylase [Rhizobium sp. BK098]MBB3618921.1 nucleoside phosphorylase [Rhizobium sp. BK609]MBB3684577.1 nucleoside phosphorylase [Rhizobium sp. BK612]